MSGENSGGGQALTDIAYLSYQKNAEETLNSGLGAGQTLSLEMSTDRNSFPNGILLKQSATQFRALINCTVKVSYGVSIRSSANNVGMFTRILNNGVAVPQSLCGASSRNSANEPRMCGKTFLVDMVANQDLQLQIEINTILSSLTPKVETYMMVEFIRRL